MSDEHASPESGMNEIEAGLRSLVPTRSRIDRDRIMFRAGQASVRPPSPSARRAWMAIAASLALVASSEAVLLANRPSPEVIERIVVVRERATPSLVEPAGPSDLAPASNWSGLFLSLGETAHERLAGQVLRYGLDGLPRSASASTSWSSSEPRSLSSRQQLLKEIRKSLDPGDPS